MATPAGELEVRRIEASRRVGRLVVEMVELQRDVDGAAELAERPTLGEEPVAEPRPAAVVAVALLRVGRLPCVPAASPVLGTAAGPVDDHLAAPRLGAQRGAAAATHSAAA